MGAPSCSIVDLLAYPRKVTHPLWAHLHYLLPDHSSLRGWAPQEEGDALDPRQVSNVRSSQESPEAFLGERHLGDRPPPSGHIPGSHSAPALGALWDDPCVGSQAPARREVTFTLSPGDSGAGSLGPGAPLSASWLWDPGQDASHLWDSVSRLEKEAKRVSHGIKDTMYMKHQTSHRAAAAVIIIIIKLVRDEEQGHKRWRAGQGIPGRRKSLPFSKCANTPPPTSAPMLT